MLSILFPPNRFAVFMTLFLKYFYYNSIQIPNYICITEIAKKLYLLKLFKYCYNICLLMVILKARQVPTAIILAVY